MGSDNSSGSAEATVTLSKVALSVKSMAGFLKKDGRSKFASSSEPYGQMNIQISLRRCCGFTCPTTPTEAKWGIFRMLRLREVHINLIGRL